MSPTGVIIGFCVWRLVYAIYKTFDEYQYVAHLFYTREILATALLAFIAGPIGMKIQKDFNLGCLGTIILTILIVLGLIAIAGGVGGPIFFWLL